MKFKTYEINFCGLCEIPIITCPHCKYGSCTGGGCEKCDQDYKEFFEYEKDNQQVLDEFFKENLKKAQFEKAEYKRKEEAGEPVGFLEEWGIKTD